MGDLKHALRRLAREPGHSALVVLTMAVGIGAVMVLAGVAYSVLLKPLPWADATRLVRLYETRAGSTARFRPMMTNAAYRAWQEPSPQTLDALGAWSRLRLTLLDFGEPQRWGGAQVTPGLFEMLGVAPVIGRTFTPGDELPGAPPVVVISHTLWRQQFGARADVLGQRITLDDRGYEVVGVMPSAFAFPERDAQFWLPFYIRPATAPGQLGTSISIFQAVGRLRAGVTAAQATAEGTARGKAAALTGPVVMAVFGSTGEVQVTAVPMLEALTAEVREPMRLMVVAVALLLVAATANVANLQLARSVSRRREFAVRAAVGAARWQLVRQSIVENLLIGFASAVAAIVLAAAAHRILPLVLPGDFPRLDEIAFTGRVQLLGFAAATGAALLFGLLPVLHAGKALVASVNADGLAPVGGALRSPMTRVRSAIMVAQVAVAFVLLAGAVLLVRSFVNLTATAIGYDRSNLLIARVVLPTTSYPADRWTALLDAIASRVRQHSAVTDVAYTTTVPFGTGSTVASFPLNNRDGAQVQVQTGTQTVSVGYFAALGQRVLEGRQFTDSDHGAAPPVAMVNREFSRRYLGDRALGWTLPGAEGKPPLEIVGVVADTARATVVDTPQPEVYFSAAQRPLEGGTTLVVRAAVDPLVLADYIRGSVREAAPQAAFDSIRTMEDLVSVTLARPRLYGVLLGTFASFALLVAAVGLFSVLAYAVAQRTREIAVRSALGAEPRNIVALVARQTAAIVSGGICLGLVVFAWAGALLQSLLYGVTTRDALSLVLVVVMLFLVALAASVLPARRAVRVDPVRVLRGV